VIVTSKDEEMRWTMFDFLRAHGVNLHRSEDFQALGRLERGRLLGVVGYNGFCGLTCQIHTAGDGHWVSREFIHKTFDYPFVQCGMEHLFAPVAATNARALRFDNHMGFTEFARIKDGYERGTDMIVLTMAKKDCKWISADTSRPLAKAA
jgi:RimJ/RimL family protein N-acetyltransferase